MSAIAKKVSVAATFDEAVELERQCHQHMIDTVPRYCAERWAEVKQHKTTRQGAFFVDSRVEHLIPKEKIDSGAIDLSAESWEKPGAKEIPEPKDIGGVVSL